MALWTKFHKNGDEVKNGWVCDSCDGWNNRPTKYCPNCGEKIKGKIANPVLTSVDDFIEASDWNDWIDEYTQDVYTIYWRWCIKEELQPETKVVFMRRVLAEYSELKSVPYKGKRRFRRI
jgi:hypothetical protein